MTTDATGAYRFDGLRLGQYGLLIHDQAGRLRAKSRAGDFVLTSNGQVASRDFSFVGLGTVTGRVLNPDSSSAQNQPVALRVQAPGFEQWRGASTNAGGFYTFEHVPVGGFIVTVSALAQQLYGEASGTLAQHGDTAQADLVLTSNAVALPRTTYDANRFPYDVRDNGAAEGGAAGIFAGGETVDRGAWLLDVAVGGGAFSRFAGGAIPTAEDGGRETVVRQEDLGGLSVTRKAYVPRNGYFVRRLEIFRNPTALPITMDVQVVSNLNGQIGITGTSSGDTGSNSAPGTLGSGTSVRDRGGAIGKSSTARRENVMRDPPAAAARSPVSCFQEVYKCRSTGVSATEAGMAFAPAGRSKPVAITVILTLPSILGSTTAP